MKRILIVMMMSMIFQLNAQQNFGLKIGGNTSGITNAKIGDNQNGYGFYAGVAYKIQLSDQLRFQPELLYSYQNIRNLSIPTYALIGTDIVAVSPIDVYNHLQYLKLPLLLRYDTANKIFVEFGPELQYLISGKVDVRNNEIYNVDNAKMTSTNDLQLNLAIGGGYQFSEKLEANLRGSWGFTPVQDEDFYDRKVFNVSVGINYWLF